MKYGTVLSRDKKQEAAITGKEKIINSYGPENRCYDQEEVSIFTSLALLFIFKKQPEKKM